jgi:hypothetical protein
MNELVRFDVGSDSVVVEVADDDYGVEQVSRREGEIIEASKDLRDAVTGVRPAVEVILKTLKDLAPKAYDIEFGIKLNAEVGAVVAKTAVEGHFTVRLSWNEHSE